MILQAILSSWFCAWKVEMVLRRWSSRCSAWIGLMFAVDTKEKKNEEAPLSERPLGGGKSQTERAVLQYQLLAFHGVGLVSHKHGNWKRLCRMQLQATRTIVAKSIWNPVPHGIMSAIRKRQKFLGRLSMSSLTASCKFCAAAVSCSKAFQAPSNWTRMNEAICDSHSFTMLYMIIISWHWRPGPRSQDQTLPHLQILWLPEPNQTHISRYLQKLSKNSSTRTCDMWFSICFNQLCSTECLVSLTHHALGRAQQKTSMHHVMGISALNVPPGMLIVEALAEHCPALSPFCWRFARFPWSRMVKSGSLNLHNGMLCRTMVSKKKCNSYFTFLSSCLVRHAASAASRQGESASWSNETLCIKSVWIFSLSKS